MSGPISLPATVSRRSGRALSARCRRGRRRAEPDCISLRQRRLVDLSACFDEPVFVREWLAVESRLDPFRLIAARIGTVGGRWHTAVTVARVGGDHELLRPAERL